MKKPKDLEVKITHFPCQKFSDAFAYGAVRFLRFFADLFFAKRYGHRAVVLETVAAVPGMVGGMLQHLRSLRRFQDDRGWIKTLLSEAENERMHLMTFIEIAHPNWCERFLVIVLQFVFFVAYFLLYILSSKTAHRFVGYLEEEAVISYTHYLEEIDNGNIKNVPAPPIAIQYWDLADHASLRDVVIVVRNDEVLHRDTNHAFANQLTSGKPTP
jgi:ubiquinol oxidase